MGWLSLGSFRGLAFRVNFTLILGALAFGFFHFAPGAWLAFLAVVVAHELGHAAFVRASGRRIASVDVHGLGGSCGWIGRAAPLQRAAIAWGGIAGQLVLCGSGLAGVALFGRPSVPLVAQLVGALVWPNLIFAALNLLPLRGLDGPDAWRLPSALLRRRRATRRLRPLLLPSDQVAEDVLERACEIVEREAEEARSRRLTKS